MTGYFGECSPKDFGTTFSLAEHLNLGSIEILVSMDCIKLSGLHTISVLLKLSWYVVSWPDHGRVVKASCCNKGHLSVNCITLRITYIYSGFQVRKYEI